MRPIDVRPVVAITVHVLPPVDLGGGRRYIPFAGGSFASDEIGTGVVLPGGVDWQQSHPDGVLDIDAHYVLESASGERVEVRSTGLRHASADVLIQLEHGEVVDPDAYYFRTAIRFSTSAPRLDRLNRVVAVATGERASHDVHIHVHEVL